MFTLLTFKYYSMTNLCSSFVPKVLKRMTDLLVFGSLGIQKPFTMKLHESCYGDYTNKALN